MKLINQLRFLVIAVLGSLAAVHANEAPVVSAGPDTTVKLVSTLYLPASVEDDSTLPDSVRIIWRQLSPFEDSLQANIYDTTYLTSRVAFPATGEYVLQIIASDGSLHDTDTVTITVIPNLPFMILEPAAFDTISIAEPCTIKWQIDPPFAVWISYSADNGIEYTKLTESSIKSGTTEFIWDVDSLVPDSTQGVLKITKYNTATSIAVPVYFLKKSSAIRGKAAHLGRPASSARSGSVLYCTLLRAPVHASVPVYDIRGRRAAMPVDAPYYQQKAAGVFLVPGNSGMK